MKNTSLSTNTSNKINHDVSSWSSWRADKIKKKEVYKQEIIIDQTGVYKYEEDPEEYKKAWKRMQNRESALK